MIKTLTSLLLCAFCTTAVAQVKALTARTSETDNGCELTVTASISGNYTSLQMDVDIPAVLTYECITPAPALETCSLQGAMLQNGLLRVVTYSETGSYLPCADNDLFTLKLNAVAEGNATIRIKNIRFAQSDGTEILAEPVNVVFSINSGPADYYDLNGDGAVNVGDVTTLVNMILGKTETSGHADLNGDGSVNVGAVTSLVNVILGKSKR